MKKFGIIGCGFLGNIVADAYVKGLLPGYSLAGVVSRSKDKRETCALKCGVPAFSTVEELLSEKPDIIVETASVDAVRENAVSILEHGCDLALISIGALADRDFYKKVQETAEKTGRRVYIAAGAVGGFDVLQTVTLMAQASDLAETSGICTHTGAKAFRTTPVWEDHLETDTEPAIVFRGSAKEAIATFPRRVNVAVATSLASTGPDNTEVTQISVPAWQGDDHCITCEIDGVKATVDIYSRTSSIAGWSLVAMLRNIISPICFY